MRGKTLFEKIWREHVITERDGEALLFVDRLLVHENSFHAFEHLRAHGREVKRPDLIFAFTDHYVPTTGRDSEIPDVDNRNAVAWLESNATENGIQLFGLKNPNQGILHVVGPEQGITLPGMIVAGADSHTSTHGALGSFAFGIGASDAEHILATQAIWRRRPRTMRVAVDGTLGFGVEAKDIILSLIGKIGVGGATGHAVEYAGSAIRALSMEGRMTVCNMSIEAGAVAGFIAPDETTFAYVEGRPWAPQGAAFGQAVAAWRGLASDPDAEFDREVVLDAADIAPMVTWGTAPEDVVPISGEIPNPAAIADPQKRERMERALVYMDLSPDVPVEGIRLDRVFIGSCTNGRIEDLRAAAEIVRGRKAAIPAMVVPGSSAVKRQAESEGLDQVFRSAGMEWRDSGCSLCVATNGDMLSSGERCASTSNRNFEGRQGRGGRTHLVSAKMAAAAALSGHLTDVRKLAGAQ